MRPCPHSGSPLQSSMLRPGGFRVTTRVRVWRLIGGGGLAEGTTAAIGVLASNGSCTGTG